MPQTAQRSDVRCHYMSMHLRCIETGGDVRQTRTFVSTARSCLCTRRPCLLSSDQHAFRRARCSQLQGANTSSACVHNIFDLGKSHHSDLPKSLSSLFSLASGSATCGVTSQLIRKFGTSMSLNPLQYKVAVDNTSISISLDTGLSAEPSQVQTVVSVTNKVTQQQAWFNEDRTRKPQLFQQSDALVDPTAAKQHCDFCKWQDYTASDAFGR